MHVKESCAMSMKIFGVSTVVDFAVDAVMFVPVEVLNVLIPWFSFSVVCVRFLVDAFVIVAIFGGMSLFDVYG